LERKNSKNISEKGFSYNFSSFPCKLVFAGVLYLKSSLLWGGNINRFYMWERNMKRRRKGRKCKRKRMKWERKLKDRKRYNVSKRVK
jgi:hypothetical protein